MPVPLTPVNTKPVTDANRDGLRASFQKLDNNDVNLAAGIGDVELRTTALEGRVGALETSDSTQNTTLGNLQAKDLKLEGGYQAFTSFTVGTTPVALNKHYYSTLAGVVWVMPALPVAAEGDSITWHLNVTTLSNVNFHTNNAGAVFRIGSTGALTAVFNLPVGSHKMTLRRANSKWWLEDSALMKEAIAGALASTFPAPVLIAVTYFSGTGATISSSATPIDTTGASAIVIFTNRYGSGDLLFDNYGNFYTYIGSFSNPAGGWQDAWIAKSARSGPGHIFTYRNPTNANIDATITVAAFSWLGVWQSTTNTNIAVGSLGASGASIPTISARTVFLSSLSFYGADITVAAGGKMIVEAPYSPSPSHPAAAISWLLVDGAGAGNGSWNVSSGGAGGGFMTLMFDATAPDVSLPVENDVYGHWLFNGLTPNPVNSLALQSRSNPAQMLTPVATVNLNGTSVVMASNLPGFLNGMTTTLADPLNCTVCAVIKRMSVAAAKDCYILGNQSLTANGGGGLMVRGSASTHMTIIAPGVGQAQNLWSVPNVVTPDWCFVAYRVTAGVVSGMINAAPSNGIASPNIATAKTMSVGNCYDARTEAAVQLELAEYIIFPAALTDAQIKAVYGRSKSRMAKLGITIETGLPNTPSVLLLASTSKGTSAAGGFTPPIDTSEAKLLVANLAYYDSGTLIAFVDSFGNSWIPLDPHINVTTGAVQQMFYAVDPITGPGHAFQVNGTNIFASMQVAAFGGEFLTPNPLDEQDGTNGSGISILIGPVDQTTPLSLVVAAAAFSDTAPAAPVVDTGFSLAAYTNYEFGEYFGGALAFKVSDSAVVHALTIDFGVAQSGMAAGIATFKREPEP